MPINNLINEIEPMYAQFEPGFNPEKYAEQLKDNFTQLFYSAYDSLVSCLDEVAIGAAVLTAIYAGSKLYKRIKNTHKNDVGIK